MKEGASIIAKGKFDINLEDRGTDEIGTLVSAFNSMAKELKTAKDDVEDKRRYIEVILDNVATGIMSTDTKGNILLLNRAARTILKTDQKVGVGTPSRRSSETNSKGLRSPFLKKSGERERGASPRRSGSP